MRKKPRRAPLYRWLRFYKHLILNSLRALFALHFDGFMAYEQQVTRDALAYAWSVFSGSAVRAGGAAPTSKANANNRVSI